MYTQPYLKTASQMRSEMRQYVRDPSSATERWSDDEYYLALNRALRSLTGRVYVPALYTLTGGFTSGVYEYTLPDYVREPFSVELRRELSSLLLQGSDGGTTDFTWKQVIGWRTEPDGSGGQKLRLHSLPFDVSARIIYFVENGSVPIDAVTLAANVDTDDTTITVTTSEDVPPTGWIKINSEWIEYHGRDKASASVTLNNVLRARYDTSAGSHVLGDTVLWGVAVDQPQVWNVIDLLWEIELHRFFLTQAAQEERRRHQEQIMWLDGQVKDFWQKEYVSQVTPSFVLGERAF